MPFLFLRTIHRMTAWLCAGVVVKGCCFSCASPLPPANQPPPETVVLYTYEVVNTYPHDAEAFTQGLDYADGFLYEGTGLYGSSSIRKVALETGEILQKRQLPKAYFGEGISVHGNRLIQLTWKSQVGFVYDLESFERTGNFNYLGEGWGLAHDGTRFIMSDGTARLRFLDTKTLEAVGELHVRYGDTPVARLNELEYINGLLYANIWKEERLAVIDPGSGFVVGWVDLKGLLPREKKSGADVLNGIAYDPDGDRIFVTGKLWPHLFEIKLVETRREAYPAMRQPPEQPASKSAKRQRG